MQSVEVYFALRQRAGGFRHFQWPQCRRGWKACALTLGKAQCVGTTQGVRERYRFLEPKWTRIIFSQSNLSYVVSDGWRRRVIALDPLQDKRTYLLRDM